MSRRTTGRDTSRANARSLFGDDTENQFGTVRPSDLIRSQRPREAAWTVFNDVEDENGQPALCRRVSRNNLVRQRPTAWRVVENVDEQDKENIGHVVRRPSRRPLESSNSTPVANEPPATPARAATTPTAPTPRSNGKRKLQTTPTPPPKKTKIATKKPQKQVVEARPEPAPARLERVRRPLEDITHLFVDPTAFYFQPWRRARSIAPRASSMRIL